MTTYPVRGWLHGLTEGSATLNEVEEVINGFIKHAEDRGWKEGMRLGVTHSPHKAHQLLCDMEPEKATKYPLSEEENKAIQSNLSKWEEGLKA